MLMAALTGAVVGLVRGGRIRLVGHAEFRRWPLLVAGVGLQVVAQGLPSGAGTAAIVISFGLLVAFALSNLRFAGMAVVALGMAMNTATIAVNGGMPVSEEAVVAANIANPGEFDGVDLGPKRHLADDDDRLLFLSDIIPVSLTREVLSFGDLVISFGVADVVYHLLRRRVPPALPPPVEDAAELGS